MLLDTIHSPADVRKLEIDDLKLLADEIRDYIVDVVSSNGGHLSSSLGVVELTLVLHYLFETPKDKIIWDVGHQCYAHKIITGRKDAFKSLRQANGISGFPKITESIYDVFNTGHSSTSLSLAIGEVVARDLNKKKYNVVSIIGDGSLTGGMAFEALNQIGHLKKDQIIILNDNEHSIDQNVGALSKYLTSLITGSIYNRMRRRSYELIRKIPRIGNSLYDFAYKTEASLKGILIPGHIFEDLGIRYFGPVDGHNIESMINIISRIKKINSGPKIIHIITKKGKGYPPAEKSPAKFHGIGSFDKKTGNTTKKKCLSYSEITGKTLATLAKRDKKIVAITAAMKLGTGLYELEKSTPKRFFDVGIAEQHAITFSAALAARGLKPFVSIYSTFIQRAVDQIIHDVAIMNLPVKLLIDRAGIVGDDGETHHGVFDISLIKNIPNFKFLAPSNGVELRDMLYYAAEYNEGPLAIRYPRGSINDKDIRFNKNNPFIPGKIKRLSRGEHLAIFAVGNMVETALDIKKYLKINNIKVTVVNLLSLKPLDIRNIERIIKATDNFISIENGVICGGIGESILSEIDRQFVIKNLFLAGFPDEFVTQGTNDELFKKYGLDTESLYHRLLDLIANGKKRYSTRHTPRR